MLLFELPDGYSSLILAWEYMLVRVVHESWFRGLGMQGSVFRRFVSTPEKSFYEAHTKLVGEIKDGRISMMDFF